MARPDSEHQLLVRLYGRAPAEVQRLSAPVSDFAFWRGRMVDRRGEVVFGLLRRGPRDERMVTTRMAGYPAGVFRVPSGGVQPGEAVIDALWREVAEELNVPFRVAAYAGKTDFVFSDGGGEEFVFPSYCFLLEQTGDRSARPRSDGGEIAAWREMEIEQVVAQAAVLAGLSGEWADWGKYRAHSTARLAAAWAIRRASVEPARAPRSVAAAGARARAAAGPATGPVDLSHRVGAGGAAAYPGDREPSFELSMARAAGTSLGWQVTRLEASVHAGTHVDAPAHLLADGATIDQVDLARLCGPAVVYDARRATAAGRPARPGDLVPADLAAASGRIALVRLGLGHEIGSGHVPPELHGFSVELAAALVAAGARGVGTDDLSVDPQGQTAVHELLLRAGLPIVELLNLEAVGEGPCGFAALPLRLAGAEAAPCRAVWWAEGAPVPGGAARPEK
jgi:kynurenine formamidase/ADP-ribose pyrophosphatase YjhB (NUDIX family)